MWKEGRASFYVIENCMSLLTKKKIKNKSKKKGGRFEQIYI